MDIWRTKLIRWSRSEHWTDVIWVGAVLIMLLMIV